MPPSAENSNILNVEQQEVTKNVTSAINYEVSLVDEFVESHRKRRPSKSRCVEDVLESTHKPRLSEIIESGASDNGEGVAVVASKYAATNPDTIEQPTGITMQSPITQPTQTRRSGRDRHKREISLARSRVRYDMQIVPSATRSSAFLQQFNSWRLSCSENQQQQNSCASSSSSSSSSIKQEEYPACEKCQSLAITQPFTDDSSVVWVPSKRSEWEDTIDEMTSLCTSAVLRKQALPRGRSLAKPFHAILSREYIRDRVDIDDPLVGFQIRHREGGWLQGFIIYTNFTTWNIGFQWSSTHPSSGMLDKNKTGGVWDTNELAKELESLDRSGDPLEGGIVFPEVAEIALLGGIGCGEYLLRMALDDIVASKKYKYLVLQATDLSRTFYEKFGFVRVGAVCQYAGPKGVQHDTSLVGYRHWTHVNESEHSLEMHGGPSYMMCLKLPSLSERSCPDCARPSNLRMDMSIMDYVMQLKVDEKPTINHLGTSGTPASKIFKGRDAFASPAGTARKRTTKHSSFGTQLSFDSLAEIHSADTSSVNTDSEPTLVDALSDYSLVSRDDSVPDLLVNEPRAKGTEMLPTVAISSAAVCKKSQTLKGTKRPAGTNRASQRVNKKSRLHSVGIGETIDYSQFLAPPKDGKPLTYIQKQYQSVWLAVSPSEKKAPVVRKAWASEAAPNTVPKVVESRAVLQNRVVKAALDDKPKLNKTIAIDTKNDRPYYCVRGPDGRFVRIMKDGSNSELLAAIMKKNEAKLATLSGSKRTHVKKDTTNSSKNTPTSTNKGATVKKVEISPSENKTPSPQTAPNTNLGDPTLVANPKMMTKQKVKSYPRTKVHFYNRVVKPSDGSKEYYFVLHYNEALGVIKVAPMLARSSLTGKRSGRPRYQVVLGEGLDSVKAASISSYQVVSATMIMKTPFVMQEAWDVEDD